MAHLHPEIFITNNKREMIQIYQLKGKYCQTRLETESMYGIYMIQLKMMIKNRSKVKGGKMHNIWRKKDGQSTINGLIQQEETTTLSV